MDINHHSKSIAIMIVQLDEELLVITKQNCNFILKIKNVYIFVI